MEFVNGVFVMALEEGVITVSLVTATLVIFFSDCGSGCLLLNCLFCQNININISRNINININININNNNNININVNIKINMKI